MDTSIYMNRSRTPSAYTKNPTYPVPFPSYGEEKASSWFSHFWSWIEAPETLTRAWKAPRTLFKLLWWRIRRRTASLSKAWGDGFRWSWLEMGETGPSDSESLSSAWSRLAFSASETEIWTWEALKAIVNSRGSQFVWEIM